MTTPDEKQSGQKTAKLAAQILCEQDSKFRIPSAKERDALVIAFVRAGYVVYGKAFDIVRAPTHIELSDQDEILKHISQIVLYEIKSTNKASVKPDFQGYFFSLSTAELLVAQNLGDRYRFAFVNTRTRTHTELTLPQVFGRAKGIYPTWSIAF